MILFLALVVILVGVAACVEGAGRGPLPQAAVEADAHPRLMFTGADLSALRERAETEPGRAVIARLYGLLIEPDLAASLPEDARLLRLGSADYELTETSIRFAAG